MKSRPILFSGPMVRALLEGRKTQTRRIIKAPTTQGDFVVSWNHGIPEYNFGPDDVKGRGGSPEWHRCPYGQPCDLLWVRECWVPSGLYNGPAEAYSTTVENEFVDKEGGAEYRADWGGIDDDVRWHPSIHMPRWASRLTLRIIAVRVQRLQSINQADAVAEGRSLFPGDSAGYFPDTWDAINGAGAWDNNPWVWALTFEVIKANVDQVLKEAA